MKIIKINLLNSKYPIYIGSGLLKKGVYIPYIFGKQIIIITNKKIASLYLDILKKKLLLYNVKVVILPDGEQQKNIASVKHIWDLLIYYGLNRTSTVIALGGGVIGDISGFTASCYQRGISIIHIPTTLLSQVDSSLGGKTGVNHEKVKNMIGSFYQPKAVIIDADLINTLNNRETSSGISEIIKYSLICDYIFFKWLETNIKKLVTLNKTILQFSILKSCIIKCKFFIKDEKEKNIRALLNLGHTFGHAIEQYKGYGNWLHGEAISVGIMIATKVSIEIGRLKASVLYRIYNLLLKAKLPIYVPVGMTSTNFIKLIKLDKKNLYEKTRLILLNRIGKGHIINNINEKFLCTLIDYLPKKIKLVLNR
ncbi:3-dehydroquinate synthase [Candidatus Portiera aleyrodidarum BT-B-HRs]|uniref:3-dehydroquinate synthase n=1 Tax=Candidatus Portiera aleyrodidarum TaxID=91844 RepID=UPI00027B30B1|nr:3-dehydroquinate synthase [Candidatus Portiera aleyrodidarum]AFQ24126.1 3-dehydroquinate synthase [Candidatus Portiera aleyrodidarum BT-B-HRs]AFT80802.1 3-dehydroquinate synthase [Candidatus Portiera aleyrodidarum BT-B-HRs]ASX27315.1 3-dehydroquinate synthase [Candidatus Portiera aleyrodidarum MED (Bemisia tabaci)]AUI73287.1 3-dehydroquinate synthase [Candidatus Portiera aleyrodidarum]